jgi:DNA-binding response OmpR family regulator
MKKRILVVDDEEMVRSSLTAVLAQMGFAADAAGDGLKALAMLGRRRYDLVITDFQMPLMDGEALTREVKRLRPSCHVVAMSGCHDLSGLLKAGADFAMKKPFSLADISLVVQRVLHG